MNRPFSFKTLTLVLLLIVSGFTVYSKFISRSPTLPIPTKLDEKFDPKLGVINTPLKLDSIVWKKFEASGYDTAKTLLFMDDFLRGRFYHSYSELSFHDNWIAFLCGKFIWSHFLFPVVPSDIISFPMAGCSQQGILFMQQLNQLKITCASLQFYPLSYQTSGHYAVTAYYNNAWHYFDPNLEPIVVDSTMPGIESIIARKLYPQMYTKKLHQDFKEYFLNKNYKIVVENPFHKGNMYYFQLISDFLSDWMWLLFLTLYLILFLKTKK